MDRRFDDALSGVAEETFGALAFLLPGSETPSGGGRRLAAEVAFEGPVRGLLAISVSADVLPVLAANMLGLDPGQAAREEQQRDALKELLNVICGNLLPVLWTRQAVFHVAAPRVLDAGELPMHAPGRAEVARTRLTLETGVADLALLVESPVPASTGS